LSSFDDDPGIPPGAIAGIIIAVVLFTFSLALVVSWWIKRQRELKRMYQENPNDPIARYLYLNTTRSGKRTTEGGLVAVQMQSMNANQDGVSGPGNSSVPVVVMPPAAGTGKMTVVSGPPPMSRYGTKDSGLSGTS
jgi:hypothetical protein